MQPSSRELSEAEAMTDSALLSDVWANHLPSGFGLSEPDDNEKRDQFLSWLSQYRDVLCTSESIWTFYEQGDRSSLYAAIADLLGASGYATVVVLCVRVGLHQLCEESWRNK